MLQEAINEVSKIISKGKEEYHNHSVSKLNKPSTSAKTYWSTLKTFYNGKKVPLLPPLQIGNTLASDFKMKANTFNKFFASQCVPLNNNSNVPYCQRYLTNAKIPSVKLENKDIINIIKALDPCTDMDMMIYIRMLKICDSAIVKPQTVSFKNCISHYRPVSVLRICGKIFERLIFNSLHQFLEEHNLFWGHPHSTYAQNSSKLDPPTLLRNRTHLA